MSDGSREQLFLVHLEIDGTDLGIWDTWAGGDKDTNSTKYRSGGQPTEESLGGGTVYTDLTIGRNYRLSRDNPIIGFLLDKCGIGGCNVQKQPLDQAYQPYGNPIIGNGRLKTVTDPKVDSNSNNAAILQIVIELDNLTVAS
jgi:hypothetical protein